MKKSLLFTLPLVALMCSCGGSNPEHDTMMAEHKAQMTADIAEHAEMEQMKETTQRFLDMWFSGKTEGIEEIVSENFVSHIPMPGVTSTGIQQLKDYVVISSTAFTDNKMEDMHLIAEGDHVAAHYRWKGVNTGPMDEGIPATNKPIDVETVDVLRFENGKVVEHWGYIEEMKMMEQLGMMGGEEAGGK
ncbi:MAG: ester cyclase [Flavobacteriales bacterium]|nr:ester cyclase [Flavobacteriales bacterium]HQV75061.1 ester cyclase [Flavobacteriales bacterium]